MIAELIRTGRFPTADQERPNLAKFLQLRGGLFVGGVTQLGPLGVQRRPGAEHLVEHVGMGVDEREGARELVGDVWRGAESPVSLEPKLRDIERDLMAAEKFILDGGDNRGDKEEL